MALLGTYTDSVLMISLLLNVTIGVLYWITGIGRHMIRKFKQRMLYKRGGYVNALFVRKDGTAHEFFKKVGKDKSFEFKGDKYAIDRRKTVMYEHIPTMLYFEGTTDPKEWSDPVGMSTGELQQIIENNQREGLVAALKQYWPIALILVIVIVVVAAGSAYLNWQIYDVIVQGGSGVIAPR